jgi:4-hydroxybenzoate polyprenyltransferase
MTGTTNQDINFPLCVDCDGTLIKTDILFESALKYIGTNPCKVFLILYWLLQGKTVLKNQLASRVKINVSSLPYHSGVMEYIRQEKETGRPIILVTASHQDYAVEIASYLNVFDEVYGTTQSVNLKGTQKAGFLTDKFGKNGFDYIGDSKADLPVWEMSRKAIIAGKGSSLQARVKSTHAEVVLISETTGKGLRKYTKLIRVHQWAKNLIIFIPLLTSHSYQNFSQGILAFFAFSFIASTTYIINDLVDLENDRLHHSKKIRPIAAGSISIPYSIMLAFSLLLAGIGLLYSIHNILFALLTIGYLGLTLVYSFYLKKVLLVDTIVLSLLYCIRLFAGHLAMNVPLSFWLLSFSIFFFFSLALAKRFMEIKYSVDFGIKGRIKGRGYQENDLLPIGVLGVSSGMLSIAIFSIYLQSERVMSLYNTPMLLILLVPLFLYWVSRVWILAYRGILNEDPVVFALKDKTSYLIFGVILLVIVAASVIIL